ncbi:hypothetical protein ONO12_28145, partial [Salmonella enterica subsp. enterica serovar Montevideo]|nr:hypothetical protein [Salmonella enterica subsp. enterica serovar Montevideo]
KAITDFAADELHVGEIHFLPYHTLGINKYHLLSQPYHAPDKPPGANPLDAVSFDAAILIEPAENDPQLQALAQAGIPCVTIGR